MSKSPNASNDTMDDVTLQINLSAGDINYAALTVPALVEQHADIKKRLLIVDCCRPQKTKLLDPDVRFPKERFEQNLEKIISISGELLDKKIVSEVYYLKPGDPLVSYLSKKYLRGLYQDTHGAGGTGNMSYWAALEIPGTRYVLHYDGDILLYQQPGFSWVQEALPLMEENKDTLMAVPRLCPPVDASPDKPSLFEGRSFTSHNGYWQNDWFSTRHFLCDKQKLEKYLPLVRGKVMAELLLRKYGRRAFPLDPEILMFKSIAPRHGKRIILKSDKAWITHPVDKSAAFVNALPQFISLISKGHTPAEQRGHEDMNLDAWRNYLENKL